MFNGVRRHKTRVAVSLFSVKNRIYVLCCFNESYIRPVAYLGYGRHGKCHGRNFEGGAKIA